MNSLYCLRSFLVDVETFLAKESLELAHANNRHVDELLAPRFRNVGD